MRWFKDGDGNTKKNHNYVKERRKRLFISEIDMTQEGNVTGNENIGAEAVLIF